MGLLYAGVFAGAVGAVVALPALRLRGIYLALSTAAFAVILDQWIFLMPDFDVGPWKVRLFGSSNLAVPNIKLPGLDTNQPKTLLIVLSVVFGLFWLAVVGHPAQPVRRAPAGHEGQPGGLRDARHEHDDHEVGGVLALRGHGRHRRRVLCRSPRRGGGEQLRLLHRSADRAARGGGWHRNGGGSPVRRFIAIGVPLDHRPADAIQGPLSLLPGAMGIGLGRNPNGAIADITKGFEPLRRAPAVVRLAGGRPGRLFGLRTAGVISNWWCGILAMVLVSLAPAVATALSVRRARAEAGR